jgi:type II secretion system protein J
MRCRRQIKIMSSLGEPCVDAAFTLIEVLLAVSVFAIVLAAINSVFFGALRLRNKTVETLELALPLRQTVSFIQKDLEGIMLPGGRLSGAFTTTIQGMSNGMSFMGERVTPDIYTSSGNVGELARWADVQKVAYFLAAPTNNISGEDGKDLVRLVTRNLLGINIEEQEAQYLMKGVEKVLLQYYDGLTWTDTWDSSTSTNLPNAVKVQITLAEDHIGTRRMPAPIELVVPILVRAAETNSTEQASGGGQ